MNGRGREKEPKFERNYAVSDELNIICETIPDHEIYQ